jgi:protoporphyrinogen oxidase
MNDQVVILGGGPAGLAASYALAKSGRRAVVLEGDRQVGGISRTVEYKGYSFDIGGHRFFTKFDEVQRLWEEVLGEDFLVRPRLSRIYYGNRFFDYPLRASNALRNLGLVEAARCLISYAKSQLSEPSDENLEAWVVSRFGQRLFDIFFKTYTEKVWGIPCEEIGAEWASQRIKNLSLGVAIKNALLGPVARRGDIASLIERFHYPRRGPGMMYDRMAERSAALGNPVHLQTRVVAVHHRGPTVESVDVRGDDGAVRAIRGEHFISSIPLTDLVRIMDPPPPPDVLAAARALTYRNLLTIDLIVDAADLFPDNWVYVHSPDLVVGRIQNFGNWSPEMLANPRTSALGLEYFVSDSDPLWTMSTQELVAFGEDELRKTGLARGARVTDGTVVRAPKAYPVYRIGYREHLDRVVAYVRSFSNLQAVGRYGMFKYNNADHSILTALLAVENIDGAQHDLWSVNTDTEYHEIRPAHRRESAAA